MKSEELKNLLDSFLCCTKYDKENILEGTSYNVTMSLLEIAKALNRIADKMGKK